MDIPTVTVQQMEQVDEAAASEYGLEAVWLMEHAGFQVAAHVRDHHDPVDRVHVYCGAGNNGGDGMAAARRLHAWGFDVSVVLDDRDLSGLAARQRQLLDRQDVPHHTDPSGDPDVIVDALLGTGITGDPDPPYDRHIVQVNHEWADVVSVDVPSGIDADTGDGFDPHVTADETLTLGLPKQGLPDCDATGELWAVDIGLPPEIYDRFGTDAHGLFAERSRVPVQ
ncbi:MAG: NAD(P)H-hydrate epimerase [Candidatus Nanohaloarchaea archaeon]